MKQIVKWMFTTPYYSKSWWSYFFGGISARKPTNNPEPMTCTFTYSDGSTETTSDPSRFPKGNE
jgi:hypothetical protein